MGQTKAGKVRGILKKKQLEEHFEADLIKWDRKRASHREAE